VCGSIGAGVGEQGGGCSDVPEGLAERKPAALEAVPGGLGPIEKKGLTADAAQTDAIGLAWSRKRIDLGE
jgi:hypothetical protein